MNERLEGKIRNAYSFMLKYPSITVGVNKPLTIAQSFEWLNSNSTPSWFCMDFWDVEKSNRYSKV